MKKPKERGGRRAGKVGRSQTSRYNVNGEDLTKNSLFSDLDPQRISNKYIEMDRVNADESKVVVKVADSHLKKTQYGYALILDQDHVVFLKNFNVNENFYGNEVMLNKQYWNVKQWGDFSSTFSTNTKNYSFDTWVKTAKAQAKANNYVRWELHHTNARKQAIVRNVKKKQGIYYAG